MLEAKRLEYPDTVISRLTRFPVSVLKELRDYYNIHASFKIVDTCAAEFAAETPYYYSVYNGPDSEDEAAIKSDSDKKKILVLGSGPIRIGQGIEFDYCSVHATWAFKNEGYETIIINNNPETVSTDFDIADKLYFEPLTAEDVENIVRLEKPDGAVVQFGGQTAIKLTQDLMKMGVKIYGTDAKDVDAAEDREIFDQILEETQIKRAQGATVYTAEEAKEVANRLGYPVLVRPSYVLGGQGMQIALSDEEIEEFMNIINRYAQDHPILVDKYLQGVETEVDAVCDGEDIVIPGIMEHIERSGIHSGDSISVYPAQSLSDKVKETIAEYTKRLAKALHVIGLINVQFIAVGDEVYIIEANPRSSRTVPYISKVTGIPIVDLAAQVMMGKKLKDLGYKPGLQPEAGYVAIKMPVFSFEKIRGAEISLGPEMKSTGECLGISKSFDEALYKAFLGAGVKLPKYKQMIITVKDADKGEVIDIARRYKKLGYIIYATRSTADTLNENGVSARKINRLSQESPTVIDLILGHKIDLVIDTPTQGRDKTRDGFIIRRTAIETGVNVRVEFYSKLAQHKGIPTVLIWVLIVVIIYGYITSNTTTGRYFYAVGGNEKATKLSGIDTNKVYFLAYMNMGFLAALAGMVTIARLTSAQPTYGQNYEMDAIGSCFIGGASAYGGIGTVPGVIVGAVLMGVINLGMSLMGVDANMQKVVKGVVLLAAVIFDVVSKRGGKMIVKN